jgi:hypothetical protein
MSTLLTRKAVSSVLAPEHPPGRVGVRDALKRDRGAGLFNHVVAQTDDAHLRLVCKKKRKRTFFN